MPERHIFHDIASFEQRLSLPDGFFVQLLREDDWSFVIKLNALFEAACAHALTTRLNAPELIDQFARLELADRERGKVKFLSKLNCITEEQAKFLRELATLRNTLAHNVSQVTFTFDRYVSGLDSNQKKKLATIFGHGCNDPIPVEGEKIPLTKFAAENTKFVIWLTAAEVLACLYLEYENAEIRLKTATFDEYRRIVSSHHFKVSDER